MTGRIRVSRRVQSGNNCRRRQGRYQYFGVRDLQDASSLPQLVEHVLRLGEKPGEIAMNIDSARPTRVSVGPRMPREQRGRLPSKVRTPSVLLEQLAVSLMVHRIYENVRVRRNAIATQPVVIRGRTFDGQHSHVAISRNARSKCMREQCRATQLKRGHEPRGTTCDTRMFLRRSAHSR